MKPTEINIQAILMRYAMSDLHHELVIPNSTTVYWWEADLLSVTKSMFVHEYEIKISAADYRRDSEKKDKHYLLICKKAEKIPNYFWYATFEFDIEPPDYAGWIKITNDPRRHWPMVSVKKRAPRLHNLKLTDERRNTIARLLSWRVTNLAVRGITYPS